MKTTQNNLFNMKEQREREHLPQENEYPVSSSCCE